MGLGSGDDAAVPNFIHSGLEDEKGGNYGYGTATIGCLTFQFNGRGGRALMEPYEITKKHDLHPKKFYRHELWAVYKGTLHAPSVFVRFHLGRNCWQSKIREKTSTTAKEVINLTFTPRLVWCNVLVGQYWLSEDERP